MNLNSAPHSNQTNKPFKKFDSNFKKTPNSKLKQYRDKNGKIYTPHGPLLKPDSPVHLISLKDKEKELFDLLAEKFLPFKEGRILPLKLGIQKDIRSRLRAEKIKFSSLKLSNVIFTHCHSIEYKKALVQHKSRYNLDGKVFGEVTLDERGEALQALQFLVQEQKFREKFKKKYTKKPVKLS